MKYSDLLLSLKGFVYDKKKCLDNINEVIKRHQEEERMIENRRREEIFEKKRQVGLHASELNIRIKKYDERFQDKYGKNVLLSLCRQKIEEVKDGDNSPEKDEEILIKVERALDKLSSLFDLDSRYCKVINREKCKIWKEDYLRFLANMEDIIRNKCFDDEFENAKIRKKKCMEELFKKFSKKELSHFSTEIRSIINDCVSKTEYESLINDIIHRGVVINIFRKILNIIIVLALFSAAILCFFWLIE